MPQKTMPQIPSPTTAPQPAAKSAGLGTRRYLELFERLTPLIGALDPGDICVRACELIAQLLEVEDCSLFLANPQRSALRLAAATHIPREKWPEIILPAAEGICGKVFSEGKPLLIKGDGHFKKQFGRQSSQRYNSSSCVIVPLDSRECVAGVINVANPVGRRAFRERDVDLLRAAANLIGCALATALQAAEIRALHRNLEDIFDSLHIGVLVVDGEERVSHSNQRARILLNLPHLNGSRPALDATLPGTIYNVCKRLMRQSGVGEETAQDRIKTHINSRELLMEITAGRTACGFGKSSGESLLMFEDVGQDEEVKRLREAESMKHNFLSIISHELRTPLVVIRSAVPLIDPSRGRDIEADTLRQVHHLMLKNCNRLSDVISSILDVTEIESGTLRLNVRPLSVHELLDEVVSMQAEAAAQRRLAWDCQFKAARHELVADQRRLRQIFCEMVLNAIKFSNPGGVIAIHSRDRAPWLEVSITNTGARIAPEQRKIVFEKFIQGNQTMTRSAGGCGLGLFLVQNLLRLHGGEIELLETEGEETTFLVRLPLEAVTGGDNAQSSNNQSPQDRG